MREDWTKWKVQGMTALKKYRGALLVVLLGVVLMLLPSGQTDRTEPASRQESFDLEGFEAKLETALSSVEGAGPAQVLLTLDRSDRKILAQNVDRDGAGGDSAVTVTLGQGSGTQQVVPLQTEAPAFRGALVVCPGGGNPMVKLRLIEAVSALTGLGSDRIAVCQGST